MAGERAAVSQSTMGWCCHRGKRSGGLLLLAPTFLGLGVDGLHPSVQPPAGLLVLQVLLPYGHSGRPGPRSLVAGPPGGALQHGSREGRSQNGAVARRQASALGLRRHKPGRTSSHTAPPAPRTGQLAPPSPTAAHPVLSGIAPAVPGGEGAPHARRPGSRIESHRSAPHPTKAPCTGLGRARGGPRYRQQQCWPRRLHRLAPRAQPYNLRAFPGAAPCPCFTAVPTPGHARL